VTTENRVVYLTAFQPNGLNNVAKLSKPSTGRLLETMKGATQLTNQTRLPLNNKPRRLPVLDPHAEKHF